MSAPVGLRIRTYKHARTGLGLELLRLLIEQSRTMEEIADALKLSLRNAQRLGADCIADGWPIQHSHSMRGEPAVWSITSKAAVLAWLGLRR